MKWNYFTRAVPEKHPRHIISDRLGGKAYIQVLFLTLLVDTQSICRTIHSRMSSFEKIYCNKYHQNNSCKLGGKVSIK